MKRTEINTIDDIINNIPIDKLDAFMIDLKGVVIAAKAMQQISNDVAVSMDLKDAKLKCYGFTWIDDGKHDIKIKLMDNAKNDQNQV